MGSSRFFKPHSMPNSSRALRISHCLPLFILLAAISPSLAQDQSPGTQADVVRGAVINAVTQEPIPRALVSSLDERLAALTDSSGHFEFSLPKDRSQASSQTNGGSMLTGLRQGQDLWLSARKPGFLTERDVPDSVHAIPGKDCVLSLIPEAIIKGRINLSSGDSAAGVTVQIWSRRVIAGVPKWMPGPVSRTNSAGEFRFAELSRGAYKISTLEFADSDQQTGTPEDERSMFPPAYFPGVPDFAAAANINVLPGQTVEADLTLTLQRYYPITIPVAGNEDDASLNVIVRGQHGPGFALGYNPGKRRIEGSLPNGNYVVEAATNNPAMSSGVSTLAVQGGPAEGPVLSLVPYPDIRIEVKEEFHDNSWNGSTTMSVGGRSFTLHGPRRYLNAYAEPAEDFSHQRGGGLRPPTATDDSAMVLDGLSPGKYWIHLDTSRGYVASATSGIADLLREPLKVVSGGNSPIEVTLRDDSAAIDGSIANQSQKSAEIEPQAVVYLIPLPDSAGTFQQVGISPDGKFEAPKLAPGSYRVLAFTRMQPDLPYRDPEGMKVYESKGQVISAVAGQKLTVQVALISSNE